MSATSSHPRRAKKVVAATIGLAVIVAGVAFAYFSSQESYATSVKGGNLDVTSDLPLNFTGQELYPTTATAPDDTAITDSFTITNENPVKAGYSIFATNTSTTPEGIAQFENLYIQISYTPTTTTTEQAIPGQTTPFDTTTSEPGETHAYYTGKLADLNEAHPQFLDTLAPDAHRTYDVAVWLADTDTEQPQGVPSDFELTLTARTPGTAPGGTATQSTSTQS